MKIIDLTIDDVKEICSWRYDSDYSIYNYPDFSEAKERGFEITNEDILKKEFKKIIDDNGNFIGFSRYRYFFDSCVIGVGMNPSYTGKGMGKEFLETIMTIIPKGTLILLDVRAFNKRAIKCYESVGFEIYDKRFCKNELRDEEFIFMKKDTN